MTNTDKYEAYDAAVNVDQYVLKTIERLCPDMQSLYEPFCFTGKLLLHYEDKLDRLVGCDMDSNVLQHLTKQSKKKQIITVQKNVKDFYDHNLICDVTYIGNQGLFYMKTFDDLQQTIESLSTMTGKVLIIHMWLIDEIVNTPKIKFENGVVWKHRYNPYDDTIVAELVDEEGNKIMHCDWRYWQPALIRCLLEYNGFNDISYVPAERRCPNDWLFMVARKV